MLVYFKGRWPEKIVPEGEPSWLYYEVDEKCDVVTRTIDLFSNGMAVRNSIKLAEREGLDQRQPEFHSLVHGPFLEETGEFLDGISEREFVELWDLAADKS